MAKLSGMRKRKVVIWAQLAGDFVSVGLALALFGWANGLRRWAATCVFLLRGLQVELPATRSAVIPAKRVSSWPGFEASDTVAVVIKRPAKDGRAIAITRWGLVYTIAFYEGDEDHLSNPIEEMATYSFDSAVDLYQSRVAGLLGDSPRIDDSHWVVLLAEGAGTPTFDAKDINIVAKHVHADGQPTLLYRSGLLYGVITGAPTDTSNDMGVLTNDFGTAVKEFRRRRDEREESQTDS